jgi:hypothetical protein
MMRTTSRLTLLAVGLIGAAVPLMGAGPESRGGVEWAFHPPVFGRVEVHFGGRQPERRVIRVEDVVPCDLHLSAYQSRDTVIVVAMGSNRTGGFTTTFAPCDLDDRRPEVRLVNTPGRDACAQVMTGFEVSSSFHTHHQLGCIKVRVAGQCFDVHVTQTPCM